MPLQLVRGPKHQRQRDAGDCTLTALSMMTGLPWEDVLAKVSRKVCHPKTGCGDYVVALRRLGFRRGDFKVVDGAEHSILSQEFFRGLFWRRPALVSIRGPEGTVGLHTVYYDGANVYDPAPKSTQRCKRFEDLLVVDFVVFRDGL